MELLVGIDLGTAGCKVMVFDSYGNDYAYAYHRYPLNVPLPGYAEQNAEDWWKALCAGTKEVIYKLGISSREIVGIGLTTQADGLVCIDEKGHALRPAIIHSDLRAESQLPKLFEFRGVSDLSAMNTYARILWLREHEQEVIRNTWKFLDVKAYIIYKLTGTLVTDFYTSYLSGISEVCKKELAKTILDAVQVSTEEFAKICSPLDIAGFVTKEASRKTGLREGVPLVVGTWDGIANIVGSGATQPGIAIDVTGTTEIISVLLDRPQKDSFPYLIPRKHVLYTSTKATGACLEWFKDQFIRPEAGKDPYELLNSEAERAAPGSNGLICLPFLEGLMTPDIYDPQVRGVFLGITLNHQKKHFIRSIMEGVAYYVRLVLESWTQKGVTIKEPIRTSGGGAKSRLWNQIKADVTGKKIATLQVLETGCLGAAILASIGIKMYKDVKTASKFMVKIDKIFKPNREKCRIYSRLFPIYKETYNRVKHIFPKLP